MGELDIGEDVTWPDGSTSRRSVIDVMILKDLVGVGLERLLLIGRL